MLENLGGWELLALILVALFVIGPERLPKVLGDVFSGIRKLRSMARSATTDLSRELCTTIELEDLHPKTFIRKHLLSEAEEDALRRPFQDLYKDVKSTADSVKASADINLTKPDPATPVPETPPPSANGAKPAYRFDDAT